MMPIICVVLTQIAVVGLALAIYGEVKRELFCYYSGMSLGVISVIVLFCTMFVL